MIGTKYGRGPQKKTTHSALRVQEGTPEELTFYSRKMCSNIGSIVYRTLYKDIQA